MNEFTVKDSGQRIDYPSGMRRDTQEGKTDWLLILDGPMVERYAEHLTKGAAKYGRRNWQLAESDEELERFKGSALRHLMQWIAGDADEDHAAAVWFNINAAEATKQKLQLVPSDAEAKPWYPQVGELVVIRAIWSFLDGQAGEVTGVSQDDEGSWFHVRTGEAPLARVNRFRYHDLAPVEDVDDDS